MGVSDSSPNPAPSAAPQAAEAAEPAVSSSSYGQILKSSSLVGGANGVNYVVGLARTKIVALLLGPSGVGLVGMYVTITGMISTVAGMGVGSSGVREIAEASGSGDEKRMAATAATLRRVGWATGLFGWILSVALAWPISQGTFGNGNHVWAIAILGSTILLGTISGAQGALIQGMRRIGDLARIQVIGTLVSTAVALGLYGWLRERGIVPVLVATAAIQLGVSWHFARRVPIERVSISWREAFRRARPLVSLGLAFMWSGMAGGFALLGIRALIVRELGLEANGIYQAAWAISGMFAGFILGAMGADFYPRLTAVAHDHPTLNRLVNEQTEIGILLALPGLLGTLAFAPWLMHLLYSDRFLAGADLLPWFVLGVFGQVVSWPMGFVLFAKGAKRWFILTETASHLLKFGLSAMLLFSIGLSGTAIAYPLLYLFCTLLMLVIVGRLTGFRWSPPVWRLLLLAGALVVAGFAAARWLPEILRLAFGGLLTAVAAVISLRGLAQRIGREHRLIRAALRFPGMRLILGS